MKKWLAMALSGVFHPLLVPTYLTGLVSYGLPTYPVPTPSLGVAIAFSCTFLLPTLGTLLLYRLGRVDSMLLAERRQRPLPLLFTGLGFGLAAWLLRQPKFALWLTPLLGGMAVAVAITLLISFYWKISAHGVGMGGAAGLLALLVTRGEAPGWWLGIILVLALAVGWARWTLRAHTLAQVGAGLALGGVVAGVVAIVLR